MNVIQTNRFHLKLRKCLFMVDEGLYLGFKVNNYEVSPVKEKIEKRSNGKRKKNQKNVFESAK